MAKQTRAEGVWGVDIGQFALKALRCIKVDDEIVAEDFEYIEYSKILSQPEADRDQLISEAVTTFLDRNDTTGDRIAITVPGQDGLTKFFKPPPSDIKKLPNIVAYEAQQQIPFELSEVIWTYQKMSGSQQEGNLLEDAEVGLFAIKRDQLDRSLRQFEGHEVDLHAVQMAPLSIYNFIAYDLLEAKTDPEDYDPDDPPPSYVVISIGTETTDMVITNGHRVWPRSLPIGGNHFTRAMTRELKLTFAKAEHLKRNAADADDQKKVILAMRTVFQDMVTEIKRSIDYFGSIDRRAKIQGVVLLGNTVKLPGLRRFLASNLGYDIIAYDSFKRLQGSGVTSNPGFRDNFLSFGPCYGLCLQSLDVAQVNTNLLPREIVTERLVEAKKPWVIASISALLLACVFNYFFAYGAWLEVNPEQRTEWADPMSDADRTQSVSSSHLSTDGQLVTELKHLTAVGDELVGNNERRLIWLELFRALNSALPRAGDFEPGVWRDPLQNPFDERVDIYVKNIESQYFEDLAEWFTPSLKRQYKFTQPWLFETKEGQADAANANNSQADGESQDEGTQVSSKGPTGPGWVIELTGYHYFNKDERAGYVEHVRNTVVKNLSDKMVMLPDADGNPRPFTMDELGIGYAVLLDQGTIAPQRIVNPNVDPGAGDAGSEADPGGGGGANPGGGGFAEGAGAGGNDDEAAFFMVKKYSFTLQFSWQELLVTERLTRRNEFVAAWNAAMSLDQVASTLGLPLEQVQRRVNRYRQMNELGLATIDLKDFAQPEVADGNDGQPVPPDGGIPEGE